MLTFVLCLRFLHKEAEHGHKAVETDSVLYSYVNVVNFTLISSDMHSKNFKTYNKVFMWQPELAMLHLEEFHVQTLCPNHKKFQIFLSYKVHTGLYY